MFEVTVEDEFSAAHFLQFPDGSWEKKHGHVFRVAVTMRSKELDQMGVVVDFEELKPALKSVLAEFHEKSFNDHQAFKAPFLNSSTENIAKAISDRLAVKLRPGAASITQVTVWETPDARATYYPEKV